jgi:DNA-binding response OmpR family regulator
MRVLVVEDHKPIAANISDYLSDLGHAVEIATTGAKGLEAALHRDFDVVVLDRMLPRMHGDEVCRRLRAEKAQLPILMLTALDTTRDKVAGFEAGADDYLVKPFALAELKVRLEALTRRARPPESATLRVADLQYDSQTLQATRAGKAIVLNPTTRKLLECLMRNTHRVVHRAELEELIWGADAPEEDILRVHMHALRAAIDRPFRTKLLRTVHGVGYRLSSEPDAA